MSKTKTAYYLLMNLILAQLCLSLIGLISTQLIQLPSDFNKIKPYIVIACIVLSIFALVEMFTLERWRKRNDAENEEY